MILISGVEWFDLNEVSSVESGHVAEADGGDLVKPVLEGKHL